MFNCALPFLACVSIDVLGGRAALDCRSDVLTEQNKNIACTFCCRDLVDEAKNYLLLPQERPLMQGPRTRPRKPIRCGEVLFAGV